jgi:hypothetical protein
MVMGLCYSKLAFLNAMKLHGLVQDPEKHAVGLNSQTRWNVTVPFQFNAKNEVLL